MLQAGNPTPPQLTDGRYHRQQQVGILVCPLYRLNDLHPPRRQHPSNLTQQSQPQLIAKPNPAQSLPQGLTPSVELLGYQGFEPPFFQRACAAASALAALGRGTLG